MLEEYQKRAVQEKHELDEKMNKLEYFVIYGAFRDLDDEHKDLLTRQLTAMRTYSSILGERISHFST